MRIVVDTNTLVSGFGWGGPPSQVVDAVLDGRATLVTSSALLAELARVLEAAAAGQADLIVTSDKAMRALGSFRGIPIVSAADCMARLPHQPDPGPPAPRGAPDSV